MSGKTEMLYRGFGGVPRGEYLPRGFGDTGDAQLARPPGVVLSFSFVFIDTLHLWEGHLL